MKRVQIVVSGRVQGVSFRAYAVQEARALGLTGYVRNLANGDVEIVADRGVHRRVGDEAWQAICRAMEAAFREKRFLDGAIDGIDAINALLAAHFPRTGPGPNELPDEPVVL